MSRELGDSSKIPGTVWLGIQRTKRTRKGRNAGADISANGSSKWESSERLIITPKDKLIPDLEDMSLRAGRNCFRSLYSIVGIAE